MPKRKLQACLVAILICAATIDSAQSRAAASPEQQEISFVQGFYDWYLLKQDLDGAIRRRPELFDAPLLRALRNDARARAKAIGEIDGLDWDPFVTGNDDPPRHFTAMRAAGSLVTVVGFDKSVAKPVVTLTAEVRCNPDGCVFVNFHYPATHDFPKFDLLSTLKLLHPTTEAKH